MNTKFYFWRNNNIVFEEKEWHKVRVIEQAKRCKNVPVLIQGPFTSDRPQYGYYTYLGFKDKGIERMPKKMRMSLLLLGVSV